MRLAIEQDGAGPVVLNAHGLTGSMRSSRRVRVVDYAPVAAAGRRLVSYDARGHGGSEGTTMPADYGWASLAEDLLALADLLSPHAPVSAIGSSMGTGTVLHAVTARPDRFDRLVLTTSPTAWAARASQSAGYLQLADVVERGAPEVVSQVLAGAAVPPVLSGLEGFPPPPDVAADLLPSVFRGAAASDLPQLESIARITQPTLILAWPGDPGHPLSTAEQLASTIPGARIHVSETLEDIAGWGARAADFLSA